MGIKKLKRTLIAWRVSVENGQNGCRRDTIEVIPSAYLTSETR